MKGFFCDLAKEAPEVVMPGLGPGVHVLAAATKNLDGRGISAKTGLALSPGHDDW
jgi:hypothetical protein